MKSVNPAFGELIKEYKESNDIEYHIKEANNFYLIWRKTDLSLRNKLLIKVAEILEENKISYAKVITDEMGKIFKQSIAEIEKCTLLCKYYAKKSEEFLKDEVVLKKDGSKYLISYQPIGIIFVVMPWNFPFWQVFRCAVPNIILGNVVLLKHARNVSGCALLIEEIFKKALLELLNSDLPEINKFKREFFEYNLSEPSKQKLNSSKLNIFKTLLIKSAPVEEVIKNDHVKGIALTGSNEAGSNVASIAGKYIKKTVLELGGSDPYIILEDADIELAVDKCIESRLLNAGQSCISAKRFIVVEKIYDEFLAVFKKKMSEKKFGDPYDDESDIGPLSSKEAVEEIHNQVVESIKKGAKCILGGLKCEKSSMMNSGKNGQKIYRLETSLAHAKLVQKMTQTQLVQTILDETKLCEVGLSESELGEKELKMAEMEIGDLKTVKFDKKGFYYPPTILVDVKKGMPAFDEELFGPVAAIIKVKNEKEAIEIANSSRFGLGSAIFTKNLQRAQDIARNEIEAGSCFINDIVKSDPELPFGGVKESGYGRELSIYGIKEFANIKTILI